MPRCCGNMMTGQEKRIQTHHKHSAIMPSGGIRRAEKPVPSHVKDRSIVRKRLCHTAERAFPHHGKARSVKRRMTLGPFFPPNRLAVSTLRKR